MAIMSICIICIIGFSNNSYLFTRLCFFLWPILLVVTAVRAGFMIFQLDRQQNKVIWECNNGGQLWGESVEAGYGSADAKGMPTGMCSAGFHSLYVAFVLSLLADFGLQVYAYFLTWRFKSRIEHWYTRVKTNNIYTA